MYKGSEDEFTHDLDFNDTLTCQVTRPMNNRENGKQLGEVQRDPARHWESRAWAQGFTKNVLRYWVQGPLP